MAKSADAFRTISEVADWLGVPTHVLRFWESKFPQVKPVKRAGGRRYYRPTDMLLLAGIRVLLHDDGVTIRGVQKILREKGVKHVSGLADREVGAGADIGAEDTAATEVEETAEIVDLSPRREVDEEVVLKPRDIPSAETPPAPKPPETPPVMPNPFSNALDRPAATAQDEGQMALFEQETAPSEASAEPAPEPASVPATSVDLPGASPTASAQLSSVLKRLADADDDTKTAIRAQLMEQKSALEALRDRLASSPPTGASDIESQ